jgi:hypothetical protein
MTAGKILTRVACFGVAVFAAVAYGQPYGTTYGGAATRPAAAGAAKAATTPATSSLKPEEIEQVVAPVALYPDSLLAQVLMAATYPLEVVQADRAAKANPKLKDSAAELNKLTWDPSVKSLINFPQVLTMMSEKLDWTVKLGDAFIADQKAVMDAVQRLRSKAYASGNLKSSDEQKVSVQPTTQPAAGQSAQVIVVESTSPSVVYVPTYNPTVVYGTWPYPSYPPYYYYPPGYVAGTAMISFGLGVACGAAWGHAWGDCDWDGGDVEIDIDKNVNFNGEIDREKFKAERDARQADRDTRQTDRQGNRDARQADRPGGRSGSSTFQHDPSHRQGVSYRDAKTTEQFKGRGSSQQTAAARDAYRGRAEAGRTDIARGGADSFRTGSPGAGAGTGARTAGPTNYRTGTSNTGTRSSSFGGVSSGSNSTRAASNRGQTSRSSPSYSGSRSSGGYSGGSRSSGASRGGGGMRGGGGRGGGRR